ncbi:serine hydrolase [Salegentibacter sediminis]|uniref:serine hydrolase n=1 Tax=Salegentibacter sediminis TaxID=1930251 RepID=UPI0018E342D4|nr:serine hydrolase [Salegentibacter sediminis]
MKKYFLLSVLFLLTVSVNAQKNYEDAIQIIEVWLDAQKDYEKLPAIIASVTEDQDKIWAGAFGLANPGNNTQADVLTLCSICSISKLFTSVAVMKLYDEGKLRLDDKIEDVLPWYDLKQQFKDTAPITIRSLLTHSSGLPRESNLPYWTGPDFAFPESEEIREGLSEQETLYPSSTYFQYSNLGLSLLGEVVAEVSGLPYEEYVQINILEPLGLDNTYPFLPEDKYGDQLAVGYGPLKRDGSRDKLKLFDAKGVQAAAGFSSTVGDLGKFGAWQLRLRDTSEAEILKPSTLKTMQRVHWTDPDWETTWGLGFAVSKGPDGTTWVSHGGSCPGYRSILLVNPASKRTYAVLINANGTNPGKYATGIHAILNKIKTETEEEKDETKKESGDELKLDDYVGYYDSSPWTSEVYIGAWGEKLVMMRLPTSSPTEAMSFYKHIEGDTFRRIRDDEELGETLEFERAETGEITRYKSHGNYSKKLER